MLIRYLKVIMGGENDLLLWLYLQFLHTTSVPRTGTATELRMKFGNSNGASADGDIPPSTTHQNNGRDITEVSTYYGG